MTVVKSVDPNKGLHNACARDLNKDNEFTQETFFPVVNEKDAMTWRGTLQRALREDFRQSADDVCKSVGCSKD